MLNADPRPARIVALSTDDQSLRPASYNCGPMRMVFLHNLAYILRDLPSKGQRGRFLSRSGAGMIVSAFLFLFLFALLSVRFTSKWTLGSSFFQCPFYKLSSLLPLYSMLL